MRTCPGLLALMWLAFPLLGGEPYLTGIVRTEGLTNALLELRAPGRAPEPLILRVGQRDRNGDIEVIAISPEKHSVTVRIGKDEQRELQLPFATKDPKALHFDRARSDQLLDLYQKLSGRTVIRRPTLPIAGITLESTATNRAEAIAAITEALSKREIFLTNVGAKYVVATRPNAVADIESFRPPPPPLDALTQPKPKPSIDGVAVADDLEVFPPGLVKLTDADLLQVLDIYSELAGRTILRPNTLPTVKITLRSQTPLSRQEAIWSLEAACHLGGIRVVPASQAKFAFVVPRTRTAPLPVMDTEALAERVVWRAGRAPLHLKEATRADVLKLYGPMVGREPGPIPANFHHAHFSVKSIGALTPVERAFVLETLAEFNHLRFHFTPDGKVTMRHISEK